MANFDINRFKDKNNIYLVPPYLDEKRILSVWEKLDFQNHVFICSSGTTLRDSIKTYAISKEALLTNARAVNDFLKAKTEDRWLASLPFYHVGGLSIYARSFLLNSEPLVPEGKWDPNWFKQNFSFASVVPTQLYDLMNLKIKPLEELKGLFVGGDFAADELLKRGNQKGWPLIVTYGMTEVGSQLASQYYDEGYDGYLDILPLHKIEGNCISTSSLYSAQIDIFLNDFKISMAESSFLLPDRIELKKNRIKPLGRKDDQFKYKGRLYSQINIKNIIHKILLENSIFGKADLILIPDKQYGHLPVLLLEQSIKDQQDQIEAAIKREGIEHVLDHIKIVDKIDRNMLGKVKNSNIDRYV